MFSLGFGFDWKLRLNHHTDLTFQFNPQEFMEHYQVGLPLVSGVGAAADGAMKVACPAVALIGNRIGFKWTGISGALLVIACMGACMVWSQNFIVLFVCYGVVQAGWLFVHHTTERSAGIPVPSRNRKSRSAWVGFGLV